MRYERKFRIEETSFEQLYALLLAHPLGLTELFPDRQVNNIYLDTPDLSFYEENLSGAAERRKYRIRWYGPDLTLAHKPVFEVKRKFNEVGDKLMHKLESDIILDNLENVRNYVEAIHYDYVALQPVLLNTYKRSYLTTFDGRFRITIDRELGFYPLEYPIMQPLTLIYDEVLVMEVKYEQENDDYWKSFSNHLPFRVTKNSKYVTGINLTLDP